MRPYGIIYIALDVTNGKVYVGQTIKTLERRREGHLKVDSPTNYCRKFRNALRKRSDLFEWSVLTNVSNQIELDEAEQYWIKFFNSNGSGGYNLTSGGMGRGKWSDEAKQHLRKKLSDPTIREKMRQAKLGKSQSLEHIAIRREAMKGRVQTEETREKLRQIANEQWERRRTGDVNAVGRRKNKNDK